MNAHSRLIPVSLAFTLSQIFMSIAWGAQDPAILRGHVEAFLQQHIASLPGPAQYVISSIPFSPSRPDCERVEVSLPPAARAYGKTTLQIKCLQPQPWVFFLPVQIDVKARYLVASRPITQGQLLSPADITTKEGLLHELPADAMLQAEQAQGLSANVPIAAGQTLRESMLRAPFLVTAGQNVRVLMRGPGFEVSSEGKALQSAAAGKSVQVRLENGQTITGICRGEGLVEVK